MFLQLFESLTHIRRNFVEVFLGLDWTAKQEKSFRILSRSGSLSNLLEILVAGAFLAATPERGQDQDSKAPVQSLVDAERNFARTALKRGIRDSFLQFLAEGSSAFAPGPTNAKNKPN